MLQPQRTAHRWHPLPSKAQDGPAKQLFDVGVLFNAATDLNVAVDLYAATHARQLVYRKATFSFADRSNDSIEAGFLYSQLELRGGEKNGTWAFPARRRDRIEEPSYR